MSTVDDARAEFSQQRSRLNAGANEESSEVALPELASDYSDIGGGKTFGQWVQIGLALSLPLIIFGCIALFVFFWMAAKTQ